VGIDISIKNRFPHELSGGQRQRIGIARALALNPKFLVCDEPISALDVSVQAQIINLLKKLQKEHGVSILFIAHDLGVVKYLSTKVAVMYLGRVVEIAPAEQLYDSPMHPYTQALISAIPIPDPEMEKSRKKIAIDGEIPSQVNPPVGCAFASRCPLAQERCISERPSLDEVIPGHKVACHFTAYLPKANTCLGS
jgi:oligopeptide/dipeptide ABC transporter ATP-binding protein